MRDAVTSQLVRYDLPGFITIRLEQSIEEALSGFGIATMLDKYVYDFTVLIDGSPQIALFTVNLYEYFIDEIRITKTSVTAFQTSSILWTELLHQHRTDS